MLSHTIPGATSFSSVRSVRTALGFISVEVFFVLSGYLIGGILLKRMAVGALDGLSGVGDFWKRRWFRTLPNYYLFLILFLLVAKYADGSFPHGTWKYFWFGQALNGPHPHFFLVAWSLAVEECFYFFFPLILWAVMKGFKNRMSSFCITIAFFLMFPPILRGILDFGSWDDALRKVTLFRLDAIMFGVILAFVKERRPGMWATLQNFWPLGAIILIGIIAYRLTFGENGNDSFFHRVIYFSLVPLDLALMFPRLIELRPPPRIFAAVIQTISLWSYSMYLSHAWLAYLIMVAFSAAGWSTHRGNSVVMSLLIWATTLPISAMIYVYFEKPIMDLRDRPLGVDRSKLSQRSLKA